MGKMTVKQHRLISGLSQKDFSLKVGIKLPTYKTKESGQRPWKAKEIKLIANILNVEIDQIEY